MNLKKEKKTTLEQDLQKYLTQLKMEHLETAQLFTMLLTQFHPEVISTSLVLISIHIWMPSKELMILTETIVNGQKWLLMELHQLDFSVVIEQLLNIAKIFGTFNQFQFQFRLPMQVPEIEVLLI